MRHDGLALAGGQQVGTEADEAARGYLELQQGPVAARFHAHQRALAARGDLDGGAHKLLRHLDGEVLDRLAALAADGLVQHLGLADLQLEALAAHGLDEHREVQHTAAVDHEGIGRQARLHAQREVLLQLLVQALLEVARGHELAVLAEEGGIVDGEEHAHRRLVDGDRLQRLGVVVVRDGVADLEAVDAHHGADVAALDLFDVGLAQALEDHQLFDLLLLHDVVALAEADVLAGLEAAAGDASDGDAAHVRGIFQGGNEQLRRALDHRRSRDHVEDGVQQRGDVAGRLLPVERHPALLRRTVHGHEVQLLLGGVQVEHEVEDLLLHLVRAAVRLVHLVDDDDGLLAHLDGLLQHETRLGHAALEGVHEQQHAVGHVEHALNLAAEVAVARGVDDVDLDTLIDDGDVLGEDGDTALALQVVVVQDQLAQVLRLTHQVGLVDHPVHERRLAVVHMGDDRYVSDFLHILLQYLMLSL